MTKGDTACAVYLAWLDLVVNNLEKEWPNESPQKIVEAALAAVSEPERALIDAVKDEAPAEEAWLQDETYIREWLYDRAMRELVPAIETKRGRALH